MAETVKDCQYPWTWMVVFSDGTVKPCCFATGALGNLNTAAVDAIWNGPVAVALRTFIKADRVHPMCAGAACKYVQSAKKPARTAPPP